ncbi:MAG: multiheme c-type cytochrome [bacterium]
MSKQKHMICLINLALIFLVALPHSVIAQQEPAKFPTSQETKRCLGCHDTYTPGIVEDWQASDHARKTPEEILQKPPISRTVSSQAIPDHLRTTTVGCYECHSQNPSLHKDNFSHFGFKINVIVSPNDCKTCHAVEVEEYSKSKKAYALDNLQKNPLYHTLVEAIVSVKEVKRDKVVSVRGHRVREEVREDRIAALPATDLTKAETCYACHGTEVTVQGMKKVSADGADLYLPDLANWPNGGVGRINPDGSRGSCTSCHPRHGFSLKVARKPYSCSQCHLEPEVPAYNVYSESKHGNIFSSKGQDWNWGNIPWRVGQDFQAPTCAVCHNSLLAAPDGKVILPRTHDFGARVWVRIFGLIYAHPQPKDARTYIIKNKDGLPLPSTFTGELAAEFLIDGSEQKKRQEIMRKVCQTCHGPGWIDGHLAKFDSTIAETNKMIRAATDLLLEAWDRKLADRSHPFDEALEQSWVEQWLFYANSVRFASAMAGPDYAAFKIGWWNLTKSLQEIYDSLILKSRASNPAHEAVR